MGGGLRGFFPLSSFSGHTRHLLPCLPPPAPCSDKGLDSLIKLVYSRSHSQRTRMRLLELACQDMFLTTSQAERLLQPLHENFEKLHAVRFLLPRMVDKHMRQKLLQRCCHAAIPPCLPAAAIPPCCHAIPPDIPPLTFHRLLCCVACPRGTAPAALTAAAVRVMSEGQREQLAEQMGPSVNFHPSNPTGRYELNLR